MATTKYLQFLIWIRPWHKRAMQSLKKNKSIQSNSEFIRKLLDKELAEYKPGRKNAGPKDNIRQ